MLMPYCLDYCSFRAGFLNLQHFEPDASLLWETILCVIGYLVPPPRCNNQTCLQTMLNGQGTVPNAHEHVEQMELSCFAGGSAELKSLEGSLAVSYGVERTLII